jgi:CDP-glycerol glycerophosphotransferase
VRQPAWNKKRSGVVFLETWHGTPLKKLVFDLDDIQSASQDHKVVFYQQSRQWDYMVSANRFSTDVFERAFVFDREKILEDGYPRNDILYADNKEEIAAEVKKELGIPENKRVILYAPTWRDNQFYGKGRYKFELAMDLDMMRRELSEDSVILLRTHYHIADILDLSEYEGFVFNGSQYEDVSRLYLASDICITDYSSVFFDYANLKRPMLFFVYDLDSYADEIRGIYFDMEKELPGPLLHTNEELVEALKNMDEITDRYKTRYDEFYERFCNVDDGHASERIIETVFGEREKLLNV